MFDKCHCGCQCKSDEKWKKSVTSQNLKEVILIIMQNAKIQKKLFRIKNAAKRVELIFNSKELMKIFDLKAEYLTKRLEMGLKKQEQLYDKFLKEMEQFEEQWNEFLSSDRFEKNVNHIRKWINHHIVYTEANVDEVKKHIEDFDDTLINIRRLKSISAVRNYVFPFFRIDWDEFWWKLCVILYHEYFAALILGWFSYCISIALNPNPEAMTCTEWWDYIAYKMCGVPSGDWDWEWFGEVLEAFG